MRNRFNINESEKNRIRDLHGMQVINEQEDMIQGISLDQLHPVTQKYLSEKRRMSVFQIISMLTDCQWSGTHRGDSSVSEHDKEDWRMEVLKPLGGNGGSAIDSRGGKVQATIFEKHAKNGPKFCLQYGGGSLCFNPCELGLSKQGWQTHPDWNNVKKDIVPALIKYIEGHNIDNDQKGAKLQWTTNTNDANASFRLKKI